MTHEMTEAQLERQQIECVFCLGGGELHEPDAKFPDEWDGIIAYWYEGAPEYAEEFKDCDYVACKACDGTGWTDPNKDSMEEEDVCTACDGYSGHNYAVRTAIMYGHTYKAPKGWKQIGSFTTSGEAECWHCGPGTDWDGSEEQGNAPSDACTGYRGKPGCPLCEGSGHVYLGDGYAEVIYRSIEPNE